MRGLMLLRVVGFMIMFHPDCVSLLLRVRVVSSFISFFMLNAGLLIMIQVASLTAIEALADRAEHTLGVGVEAVMR
jgi:hypothetical protein